MVQTEQRQFAFEKKIVRLELRLSWGGNLFDWNLAQSVSSRLWLRKGNGSWDRENTRPVKQKHIEFFFLACLKDCLNNSFKPNEKQFFWSKSFVTKNQNGHRGQLLLQVVHQDGDDHHWEFAPHLLYRLSHCHHRSGGSLGGFWYSVLGWPTKQVMMITVGTSRIMGSVS